MHIYNLSKERKRETNFCMQCVYYIYTIYIQDINIYKDQNIKIGVQRC